MPFLKHTGLFILSFLMLHTLAAQSKRSYVLSGYMGVQGGESFTYRLELKDSTGDYLSGYSYIYKTINNDVKTAVVVRRNKLEKSLHLQETNIIYNNNFKSKAVICLVESDLTFNQEEQTLKGSLITQTIGNGGTCSLGSILLNNTKEIDQLFSDPIPEKSPVSATSPYSQKPKVNPTNKLNQLMAENQRKEAAAAREAAAVQKAKAAPAPAQITEGKEVIYDWHSDQIVLKIWDGSQEDDDRVTLFFNGEPVLSNYTLKNQVKTLSLKIIGYEINTITIEALNEGAQPPNTANIQIEDGDKAYEIIAYNKIGKKAFIKVKRKR